MIEDNTEHNEPMEDDALTEEDEALALNELEREDHTEHADSPRDIGSKGQNTLSESYKAIFFFFFFKHDSECNLARHLWWYAKCCCSLDTGPSGYSLGTGPGE